MLATPPFLITLDVFEPGAGGIPDTTLLVGGGARPILSWEHTISATFGFESATATEIMTMEEAQDWLARGLMRSCAAYSPDGDKIWEGLLVAIEAQFGQETRTVSLDDMANGIVVHYTTVLGTPGTTAAVADATSQAQYGVKQRAVGVGETTGPAAAQLRDRLLAQYKRPPAIAASEIQTGDLGDVRVTLHFAGWYATLDWLLLASTSTTNTSTTTQVGTLLTTVAGTNAFIATSTLNIAASGISDTEYIAADTPARQKIEALLGQGNSSGQRLAYGVYEDRLFSVTVWAGATPTTIHYQRSLGSADLLDANGGDVFYWDVRPDRMYQVVDLLDVSPNTVTADAAGRSYIERVTFHIDAGGMSLSLEPQAQTSADAMIARLNR